MNKTSPFKLLSKREFNLKKANLQKKHFWLLKGKPIEIRPGWLNILNEAFLKIKSILTEEDLQASRLDFVHSDASHRFNIFLDGEKLSSFRYRAVEHLLHKLVSTSESTCAKCGCEIQSAMYRRQHNVCEEHYSFSGDFVEDYELHLKEEEAKKQMEENEESAITAEDKAADTKVDIEEFPEEALPDAIDSDAPKLLIYDVEEVEKILRNIRSRSADMEGRERIKALCNEMIKKGGARPYCTLPEIDVFDDLVNRFPNLSETIETIKSAVALAQLGDGRLEVPPLLLVGPPGVGKTQVTSEIAKLFETEFVEIHMESEQNGASIAGSSEFWSNTQTGLVFNTLARGLTANPIILIDELDKVSGDYRYDPAAGLYGLLERETARRFEDMSLRGLKMNASAIIWIVTANDISRIPAPILSRVMVQHIRPPSKEESMKIAQNIYDAIRNSKAWGRHFQPELSSNVLERLSEHEPRKMKTLLQCAFGLAAIMRRDFIRVDDFPSPKKNKTFGFITDIDHQL